LHGPSGPFFLPDFRQVAAGKQKKARKSGLINKGMKKRELVLSFFILIKTFIACHAFCMTVRGTKHPCPEATDATQACKYTT
jgi:hypothetical protein